MTSKLFSELLTINLMKLEKVSKWVRVLQAEDHIKEKPLDLFCVNSLVRTVFSLETKGRNSGGLWENVLNKTIFRVYKRLEKYE